jgi:hypothetical protein
VPIFYDWVTPRADVNSCDTGESPSPRAAQRAPPSPTRRGGFQCRSVDSISLWWERVGVRGGGQGGAPRKASAPVSQQAIDPLDEPLAACDSPLAVAHRFLAPHQRRLHHRGDLFGANTREGRRLAEGLRASRLAKARSSCTRRNTHRRAARPSSSPSDHRRPRTRRGLQTSPSRQIGRCGTTSSWQSPRSGAARLRRSNSDVRYSSGGPLLLRRFTCRASLQFA